MEAGDAEGGTFFETPPPGLKILQAKRENTCSSEWSEVS